MASVALAPGATVGNYTLVAPRGAGGMGSVWDAEATSGRLVALKVMHDHLLDDPELQKRFIREFEVGRTLRHPNLIQMIEFGHHQGVPFLVMELATGKSIRRLIERGGPFREWEALEMMAQIADGLGALEANGIVHRDLKSSNVVVDRDLSVKIIDFGIARVEGERTLGNANSFVGSAEFSSPEYYFGRIPGTRADIYSAGVLLFEMLTGRVPFRSDRYTDTLKMHATLPVPRPTDYAPVVSAPVDELAFDMMQKQPERRPSAREVARRCREILASHGRESAPASSTWAPAPPTPTAIREPQHMPRDWEQSGMPIANRGNSAVVAIVAAAGTAIVLVGGAILAAAMSG